MTFLEHSGSLHLKCSFTYDFSLHASLQTWWTIHNGNGTFNKGSILEDHLPSAVDSDQMESETDGIIATVLKGRAMYLMYPYRKVSTVYLTLVINNPRVEDSGAYTCHANTTMDNAASNSAKIEIIRRSRILKQPKSISAVLGGSSTLSCEILIDSRIVKESEIYWTFNERQTSMERIKHEKVSANTYLVSHKIESLSDSDIGDYQCHAITSYDSVHSTSVGIRLLRATEITRHPSDTKVALGGIAQFRFDC